MKERPKVGIAVIVVKDKKVLLGKRHGAHGQGTWGFPGGHLEFGERWETCAKRETKEETNLTLTGIHFGAATNDVFTREKKHYITVYLVAKYKSGVLKVMEPHKCEKWEWFFWERLPRPLFLPIRNLLRQGYHPLSTRRP